MIFGKLSTSGVLNNIYDRDPIIWEDGSTDVEVVTMPTFDGPYGYDSINKVAISNPTQQSLNEQIAALDTIIKGFGIQVPMETIDDIITEDNNPPIGLAGLAFDVKPNESWHGQWTLYCSGSTGGMKFGITGPPNPVQVQFSADGNTTSVNARTVSFVTAYNVLTTAVFVNNATVYTGKVQIDIHIINGLNAGKIQLGFASAVNGQSNRVIGGSFGRSWRAAV